MSRTHRATYEIPRTDARVDCLGGIPAHMLDGATLYVDGATSLEPGRVSVPATDMPATPERKWKSAEALLDMIGPDEVIPKAELAARDRTRKRSAAYSAIERLLEDGRLFVAGRIKGASGNQFPVTLITRNPDKASTTLIRVTDSGVQPIDDALPIIAVLTPPLPKFRILSTRVMG